MAKAKYKKSKSKKQRYSARPPAASKATSSTTARKGEVQPKASAPAKAAAAPGKDVDFRSEYRYVLGDLKRIGILAAAMFATLVVLALVVG